MVTGKSLRIDVSKEQIDEALSNRIKELEREVKKLTSDRTKLRKKVQENDKIVGQARDLRQAVLEAGEFCDEYCQ